jgi:hypothetical protein
MDIFITNIPPHSNQTELRLFLRDIVGRCDILAFDIFKQHKQNWAVLTTASADNGQKFLQTFGGPVPLAPLHFKTKQLKFQKSNKRGQPDKLKVRVLMEKESAMRAKRSKDAHITKASQPSRPILEFIAFHTGVWEYDYFGKLAFDLKHKDERKGTITLGKSALVVYLAAGVHDDAHWHCRIDIPYSIVEHVIPSQDNKYRGNISLTLRSPPKIYRIVSPDELHLYTGREFENDIEKILDMAVLSLTRPSPLKGPSKKLIRETSIMPGLDKNSALCLVYRFTLPDVDSAQRAWHLISQLSALPRSQAWKTSVPATRTSKIESEYIEMERELALLEDDSATYFTFAVRFQLLALVLEATLTPTKVIRLISHVKLLARLYGSEHTSQAVRKLQNQIPTPGPDVDAEELSLARIVDSLTQNIQDYQVR